MFLVIVLSFMVVLPLGSVILEYLLSGCGADLMLLAGKWFVFWAVGMRLFTAGLRQMVRPDLTAKDILGITDQRAFVVVRELGFANISMGLLGLLSLFQAGWTVAAAIPGGLFIGLAGINHILRRNKNALEKAAMLTNLFVFAVLLFFLLTRWFR